MGAEMASRIYLLEYIQFLKDKHLISTMYACLLNKLLPHVTIYHTK